MRRPTSSQPAPSRMNPITARYDHCPIAQPSPGNIAAGVAPGSARAAGSVRGVPVGWASMARRATARSRGRPDVHSPSSRSDASRVKALQASGSSAAGVASRQTTRPSPGAPRTSSRREAMSLNTYGIGSAAGRLGGGSAHQADPRPAPAHCATARRDRLRSVQRLSPVPPGKVRAVPGGPTVRRIPDGEHPGGARSAPRVDQDRTPRRLLNTGFRQPHRRRTDSQRDEHQVRPRARHAQ